MQNSDSESNESTKDNEAIDQDIQKTSTHEKSETKEETPSPEIKKAQNEPKKNKKDNKSSNAEANKEDEVIELKCTVCLAEFETRNKLFDHIKAEDHQSVPKLSYNQIKKNRILLAKLNKNKKK